MADLAYEGSVFEPQEYTSYKKYEMNEEDTDNLAESYAAFVFDFSEKVDHHALSDINQRMIKMASALAQTNAKLKIQQEKLTDAENEYKHAYNVAITLMSGGTEKSRVAAAELATEEEYNEMKIRQAKVAELKNLSMTIRASLDAVTVIANNMRAETKIV